MLIHCLNMHTSFVFTYLSWRKGTTVQSLVRSGSKSSITKAQELCESRGGRPLFPVPNKPYGLYGRKATLN